VKNLSNKSKSNKTKVPTSMKLISFGYKHIIHLLGIMVLIASTTLYSTCTGRNNKNTVTARMIENKLDIGRLTPSETKILVKLLNREVSPCGDDISLGQTIMRPETCPIIGMASEFILNMLMDDYNADEISTAYMKRYAALKGLDIAVNGSPVTGAENYTITLVVFSDFECPYCAKAAEKVNYFMKAYPDNIRVIFKHFPLEIHPTSKIAARAAFAAHRQNKFWEMHDTLFSAQGSTLDRERITVMATGLGMDIDQFNEDMGSPAATAAIAADKHLGEELGVDGTPQVFINGRPLEGGVKKLETRIKEELLRQAVLSSR